MQRCFFNWGRRCLLADADLQWFLLQSFIRHFYAGLHTAFLTQQWAEGHEVKCQRAVLAQGLADKQWDEKEFTGVQHTVVLWFGLPFPAASNNGVVSLLSKLSKLSGNLQKLWQWFGCGSAETTANPFDGDTKLSGSFQAEELPLSVPSAIHHMQITRSVQQLLSYIVSACSTAGSHTWIGLSLAAATTAYQDGPPRHQI